MSLHLHKPGIFNVRGITRSFCAIQDNMHFPEKNIWLQITISKRYLSSQAVNSGKTLFTSKVISDMFVMFKRMNALWLYWYHIFFNVSC